MYSLGVSTASRLGTAMRITLHDECDSFRKKCTRGRRERWLRDYLLAVLALMSGSQWRWVKCEPTRNRVHAADSVGREMIDGVAILRRMSFPTPQTIPAG
ncbi:hypothetical protein FA95DRAFT_358750 [Auriscalpium vulgare]|uniref:Uncharacterized protein n=1 Tax=Auriscalpium vulgare TaxID=40419 RepID=A0ACB8S527_9AGAM|nr:hypothetical protein FA95DRAFT_358750 [Auriscalpium vulgare]